MNTKDIAPTLGTLFAELVNGAAASGAYMLNAGDAGLLASLDQLTAAAASRLTTTGSSIAAHVEHLRYGLSLMNRWNAGENPFADADWSVSWKKTVVDKVFRSEGVAVADVNKDGKPDIIVGDVWYEAPDWKMHEIRTPGNYGDGSHGYSQSFACFAADLNHDGLAKHFSSDSISHHVATVTGSVTDASTWQTLVSTAWPFLSL